MSGRGTVKPIEEQVIEGILARQGATRSGRAVGASKAKRPTARNNKNKGRRNAAAAAGGAGGSKRNNNRNNNRNNRGRAADPKNLAWLRGNNEFRASSNVEGNEAAAAPAAAAAPISMLGVRHLRSRGDLDYAHLIGVHLDSTYEDVFTIASGAFSPSISPASTISIAAVEGTPERNRLIILGRLASGQSIRSIPRVEDPTLIVFVSIEDPE
jgi:hypothetical protein